jgi:multidrug efflux pump subunit AcrA (membrane-fusion protein)
MNDVMKKRKRRKWLFVLIAIIIVLVVAAVLIVPRFMASRLPGIGANQVLSAQVQTGDISTTVVGTGNIEDGEFNVKIPYDVEIDEIYVKSGDTVQAGDALATVDKTSLSNRIADVKDELTDINDQIDDLANNDTETVTIKSQVPGRVKKIYAANDGDVAEIIEANKALMLLSLDGKMSVRFDSDTALSRGTGVTVVLSDGTEKDGIVESTGDKTYTVTLTDNGTDFEDKVTIKYEDKVVGSGVLAIHNPLKITGTPGTVTSISVSEGTLVSAGTSLLSIQQPTVGMNYTSLIAKRDNLTNLLEKLSALSITHTIYASESGEIGSVSISEGNVLSYDDAATDTGESEDSSNSSAQTSPVSATTPATSTPRESQPEQNTGTTPGIDDPPSDEETTSGAVDPPSDEETTSGAINTSQTALNAPMAIHSSGEITAELSVYSQSGSPLAVTTLIENEVVSGDETAGETDEDAADDTEAAAEAPSAEETFDNEGTAITIKSQTTVQISVSIDELDIAAMKTGLETSIEIDAIEGETFSGTVSDVSDSAEVSNGVAKYTALIQFDKTSDMKIGMSATATITKEKREGVLTVPLAAVQEFGDQSYVNTSYDDGTGLGGQIDITTGLSDGTNVEVTSGLNAGDTIYYIVIASSDDTAAFSGGMGFGGGMTGGGMPSGGERPSFTESGERPTGAPSGGSGN